MVRGNNKAEAKRCRVLELDRHCLEHRRAAFEIRTSKREVKEEKKKEKLLNQRGKGRVLLTSSRPLD